MSNSIRSEPQLAVAGLSGFQNRVGLKRALAIWHQLTRPPYEGTYNPVLCAQTCAIAGSGLTAFVFSRGGSRRFEL